MHINFDLCPKGEKIAEFCCDQSHRPHRTWASLQTVMVFIRLGHQSTISSLNGVKVLALGESDLTSFELKLVGTQQE